MNNLKSLSVAVLFLLLGNKLSAHALWIETSASGKTGAEHQVKVFYGEFASNEREEISKWYSDVKDFSLWLTTPGKEKIKLKTSAGTNYYSATFTPDKDGLYILTVSHEAKELGGTTKYEFLSSATVAVGDVSIVNLSTVPSSLAAVLNESKTYNLKSPVKFSILHNGKPVAAKKISVLSPEGWTKEFTSDEKGEISFTPQWPGRYLLEVSTFEKTSGQHHGKTYDAFWQGATSSFEVI